MSKLIVALTRDSEHLDRMIVWNEWYKNHFFVNIQAGQKSCTRLRGPRTCPFPNCCNALLRIPRLQRNGRGDVKLYYIQMIAAVSLFISGDDWTGGGSISFLVEGWAAQLPICKNLLTWSLPGSGLQSFGRSATGGSRTSACSDNMSACLTVAVDKIVWSMELYAECRIVSSFAQSRLGLATPLLHTSLQISSAWHQDTRRTRQAKSCADGATNAARHGGTSNAVEAMSQVVKEACAAHVGLATMVADIWRSTHA